MNAPGQDHVEIELKLALGDIDARRIARLPLIRGCSTGRAGTRAMHSIYYDTPDRALQRARTALRLRREGTRWVQTIKFGGGAEGGLHNRHEIETRLAMPLIDQQALVHPALQSLFDDSALRAAITPVFTAEFRRTTRLLSPAPGTTIELCVDIGEIRAGERREPIREIELELKSGSASVLLEFADALVQQIPVRLEPASKAERGFALALGEAPAPVRAQAPHLDGATDLEAAFRAIVFSCVRQLQANERGVLDGSEAEYLHQARVALRRLRSAMAVFDSVFPRESYSATLDELRWLDRCLGPARDWDVFVLSTLPQLSHAFPDDAGLLRLARHADTLREEAGRIARDALSSARYTRVLLGLNALFLRRPWMEPAAHTDTQPARATALLSFAKRTLARRHRKVIKRGRDHARLNHTELHALRIEGKKLRYAGEFVGGLFERKAVRTYLRALTRLQELLGGLNDAATVDRLCHALRAAGTQEPADEAVGILRGWAAALAQDHLSSLPKAWKRFRATEPFW